MAEAFRTLPLRQNLQSACCRTGWFRTDFYLQSRSILSKVRLHDEVIIADRCPNSLGRVPHTFALFANVWEIMDQLEATSPGAPAKRSRDTRNRKSGCPVLAFFWLRAGQSRRPVSPITDSRLPAAILFL